MIRPSKIAFEHFRLQIRLRSIMEKIGRLLELSGNFSRYFQILDCCNTFYVPDAKGLTTRQCLLAMNRKEVMLYFNEAKVRSTE